MLQCFEALPMFPGNTSHEIKVDLSENFGPNLARAIRESGDATNSNVDSFFSQLNVSVPKMGPGLINLGESVGKAMGPAKSQFINGMLAFAAISTATVLIKHIATKYIGKYFFEPSLIKRSSQGIVNKCTSWFKSWFQKPTDLKDHMVISDQLFQELNYIMKMTINIKNNGGYFEHVLLHGAPGTGKTLFAQLLAQYCGMDFAIVPAANISQFLANGTVVEELTNLFRWASKNKRGTIIFFDEAETFLAHRNTLSAAAQNALGSFLEETGTPSNRIMVICATNRPEILDKAVIDRLGMHVEFPLPDLQARQDQLVMHIDTIFGKQIGKKVKYGCLQDKEYIMNIAQLLEGYSGRKIQKFVNRLRQQALAENIVEVNHDLVNRVIKQMHGNKKLEIVCEIATSGAA